MDNTRNDPQVLGGSRGEAIDSMPELPGVRGDNLRARFINCQTNTAGYKDSDKLNILTYNVRTLRTEERLIELENALNYVNWDIMGLSEVRREGEDTLERNHSIFYFNGITGGQSGVGFMVAKKWKSNIIEFVAYSDRIALLKFRVMDKKTLTIIQVYAPTSAHPDEEVEEFYDLLNKACDDHRGTWTMILGDFNAKLGSRDHSDNNTILGPYGLGTRNIRGERLLQFAFGQSLSVSNSFFYKKPQRRWTWFSSDGVTKNEIDFCLSSNKQFITGLQILNKIRYSSDHRPLRVVATFDYKIYRAQIIRNSIKKLDKTSLIINREKFNLELKNSFNSLKTTDLDDTEQQYTNIKTSIKNASMKVKPLKRKFLKLSQATLEAVEERQSLLFNSPEFRLADRRVKRSIRKDVRQYNDKLVQIALESNRSLKFALRGTAEKNLSTITKIKDHAGISHSERDKVMSICTDFYKKLYSAEHTGSSASQSLNDALALQQSSQISPQITGYEVHCAMRSLKYNRSPGEDGISTETLKIGEPVLLPHITNLFNSILRTGSFPYQFCHSTVILLHKKGDKSEIGNYRPISLVSHLYKTFVKVIENRISGQLDAQQPPEQAGFRRGLSTTDHLHSLNQMIEKCTEFRIPLYLAFVDYAKAFDSIHHASLFDALLNQNIDTTYVNLLRAIYRNSTAAVKITTTGPPFPIKRGVKQGDPLSPKLFTATLEEAFRKLADLWADKGVVVGEKRLTNLRFADDIVLFSSSAAELGVMLSDLNRASLEIGLRMNMSKTKLMTNSVQQKLCLGGVEIAYVPEYIYLGQIVSFQARQEKEIARRTENAWKSYWSMKALMKGDLPICYKRRLMDMCILPIFTYGAQTWSLTAQQRFRLEVSQRAMERSILGVRITDRIRNTMLRSKTQIADVTQKAAKLKWDWAGHICRMSNGSWAKTTTMWVPENVRRHRGRPRRRWRDELDAYRQDWSTIALNREDWKEEGEAFALQWDRIG